MTSSARILAGSVTVAAAVLLTCAAACATFASEGDDGAVDGDPGLVDAGVTSADGGRPEAPPDGSTPRAYTRDFDDGGDPAAAELSFTEDGGQGSRFLHVAFTAATPNPSAVQEAELVDGPLERLVVGVDARGFSVPSVGDGGSLATANILVVDDGDDVSEFQAVVQLVRGSGGADATPFLRLFVRGKLPGDGGAVTCLLDMSDVTVWRSGKATISWLDGGASQQLQLGSTSVKRCSYALPKPARIRFRYGVVESQNSGAPPWDIGIDNVRIEVK